VSSKRAFALIAGAVVGLTTVLGGPAVAVGPSSHAVSCPPGIGVGLADIPAGTKDPRALNYIIDHVQPGASFTRRFQVCNGTAHPVPVQLYAGAAVVAHGGFNVVQGTAKNELSRWITITPRRVTLAPGQRVIAVASFHVPQHVSSGERYAALLVALPPRRDASGVSVVNRVGVRVYLDVSPGSAPRSDFVVDSLQAVRRADGTPEVLARVRNTGGRAIDVRGTLRLSDGPGGLNAGPFAAQVATTLKPGDAAPVTVPLSKAIRGGPWHAVVDLHSGLLERKAEGNITFPAGAGSQSSPVKAKALPLYRDRGILLPIAAGLVGLLLLLLLLFFLRSRRRRPEGQTA
jgi:hypothetical protein